MYTWGRAGRRRAGRRRLEADAAGPGRAPAAMERDGEQLSARPALETEGLRFLHVTVGSLLATYGWYIVFSCILLYVIFQKLSTRLRALRQRQLDQAAASVEPDVVVKRQEAVAAARLKMQEELNAQVEKHKERLRQLEEEKRRQKIELWDNMQEGKSYKGNARKPQEEDSPGPSTSLGIPKRKPDRKPLRGGGYNPLSGEGGGACSWRPGRRGPTAGG